MFYGMLLQNFRAGDFRVYIYRIFKKNLIYKKSLVGKSVCKNEFLQTADYTDLKKSKYNKNKYS